MSFDPIFMALSMGISGEIGVAADAAILRFAAGRGGKQAALKGMASDSKLSKSILGRFKNEFRRIKSGNGGKGLRVPFNGRKSPGRKSIDKDYEMAHSRSSPASKCFRYKESKLKLHKDHKVETRLARKKRSLLMNEHKIRNILKLLPKERYDYFIREVVKSEKVWAVSTKDSWIMIDDKEDSVMLVWPHEEVAKKCLFDEFMKYNYELTSICLTDFLKHCISGMNEDGVLFGVFYNLERSGLAVSPSLLKSDIECELELYE